MKIDKNIYEATRRYYEKMGITIPPFDENKDYDIRERTKRYHYKEKPQIDHLKVRASELANNYKKVDKKKGRDTSKNIKPKEIYKLLSDKNAKCFYCGKGWGETLGLDRVNSCKPHTPDNVVLCCPSCNSNKNTQNFYDYIQKLIRHKKASEDLLLFNKFASYYPTLLCLPVFYPIAIYKEK